ncbi:MAG TPA: hypothetical protein VJA22_02595, partial [Patescibacteria group bacterium]|nr:hypothetical protein [Patescibacteria group bacterium]
MFQNRERMIGDMPPFRWTNTKTVFWVGIFILTVRFLPVPFMYFYITAVICGIFLRFMMIAFDKSYDIDFLSVFVEKGIILWANPWMIGLAVLINVSCLVGWLLENDRTFVLHIVFLCDGALVIVYFGICSGYLTLEYVGRSILWCVVAHNRIKQHNAAWKEYMQERAQEQATERAFMNEMLKNAEILYEQFKGMNRHLISDHTLAILEDPQLSKHMHSLYAYLGNRKPYLVRLYGLLVGSMFLFQHVYEPGMGGKTRVEVNMNDLSLKKWPKGGEYMQELKRDDIFESLKRHVGILDKECLAELFGAFLMMVVRGFPFGYISSVVLG